MRIKNVAGANGYGDHILASVKNAETIAIPRGTPVILNVNGTNDGFDVVLPSTAGASKANALAWGVSLQSIPAGARDDVFSTGYVPYALVQYATRGATSNSWTSSASIAALAVLTIDTVNNAYNTAAATVGSGVSPYAVLLDSIASFAASATATTDTRTALTTGVRVFIRYI